MALVFWKRYNGSSDWTQVSLGDAEVSVYGTYGISDQTTDWLTIPNIIPCHFATIVVTNGEHPDHASLEWELDTPSGAEYDDNGKRIRQ